MPNDREVENVAQWIQTRENVAQWIQTRVRLDNISAGDLARALLDSGALTMGACAYYDNESVRMMTVDYDSQAAAIERIKGGGDDR